MPRTTYRSKVAVTGANKRQAYKNIDYILEHIQTWGVDLLRIERMPDAFIEVDVTDPIPAAQLNHLGLTGPV